MSEMNKTMKIKVTTKWKGEKRTKMWIVHLENGTTRGFPAHLYSKQEAVTEARAAITEGERGG